MKWLLNREAGDQERISKNFLLKYNVHNKNLYFLSVYFYNFHNQIH